MPTVGRLACRCGNATEWCETPSRAVLEWETHIVIVASGRLASLPSISWSDCPLPGEKGRDGALLAVVREDLDELAVAILDRFGALLGKDARSLRHELEAGGWGDEEPHETIAHEIAALDAALKPAAAAKGRALLGAWVHYEAARGALDRGDLALLSNLLARVVPTYDLDAVLAALASRAGGAVGRAKAQQPSSTVRKLKRKRDRALLHDYRVWKRDHRRAGLLAAAKALLKPHGGTVDYSIPRAEEKAREALRKRLERLLRASPKPKR